MQGAAVRTADAESAVRAGRQAKAGNMHPRARIFAAALRCFKQHGIQRTSMEAVALEAGVSRPTIYYYFADKQELILEAVLRQQTTAQQRHLKRLAGVFNGMEAIIEALVLGVEQALRDPFTLMLTGPENERLTAMTLTSEAAWKVQTGFWGPLLSDARARRDLREDLSDEEIIRWITFVQFSMLTNGGLFGLHDPAMLRRTLQKFLGAALQARPMSA